ncbi:MAG: cytochrome P450 [Acidimicrobiia bacterium]
MAQRTEITPLGLRLDLTENHLPAYRSLREAGSLIANNGAVPVPAEWYATDWDTISFVFRHPELFSSAASSAGMGPTQKMIPLEVDPPDHKRYRRLLDYFFSPNRLRPLEASLRQQINDIIDTFIDRGSVDLLEEFFIPYPTQVFLTMYGLPLADRPKFLEWKDALIRGSRIDLQVGVRAGEELYAYMAHLIANRDPSGEDLMSSFLRPNEQGDRLTDSEIMDITYLFVLAGLDTVTTALAHSFGYLATHREARQEIIDDPSIIPGAVEEMIRVFTPAPALTRTATQDVEVAGVLVKKGQGIFCHLGAANGDSQQLANAETIDLHRAENRHSSFGLGIHRCLGSHLARMEVRLVMEEFHRRIPHYALAEGTELFKVPFFEGLDSLPIVFPAGGR